MKNKEFIESHDLLSYTMKKTVQLPRLYEGLPKFKTFYLIT